MTGSRGDAILVVDNDEAFRQMVGTILELEGYLVVTARDGREALDEVGRAVPRLILLDLRMPGMDGRGLAAALKARQLRIPVVVMTGAQDARRWAREIGADDCLAKPFDIEELLRKVRRLCPGPPDAP